MLKRAALTCVVVGLSFLLCSAAQAGLITSASATASSSVANSYGTPNLAVDGTGMDATRTTHDNTFWNTHWVTAEGTGNIQNAWFRVDLGGEFALDKLLIWNCNDPAELLTRCVAQGDVYVSNALAPAAIPTNNASSADWSLVAADYSFAKSAGLASQPYTDLISLAGRTGRFVAIKIDSNGGTDTYGFNFASLAEVQVFSAALPEPGSLSILASACLSGLLCYVRRKRK